MMLKHKDRFVVVDAVGVTETDLIETLLPLGAQADARA